MFPGMFPVVLPVVPCRRRRRCRKPLLFPLSDSGFVSVVLRFDSLTFTHVYILNVAVSFWSMVCFLHIIDEDVSMRRDARVPGGIQWLVMDVMVCWRTAGDDAHLENSWCWFQCLDHLLFHCDPVYSQCLHTEWTNLRSSRMINNRNKNQFNYLRFSDEENIQLTVFQHECIWWWSLF